MQSGFDPYHEWLGIPDAQETPNHYRLLGLRVFEDDRKAITNAASRVSGILVDHLAGPHRGDAERLLSQVDLARRCLLNSTAKEHYDKLLREELIAEPPRVNPKATFIPQAGSGPLLPPGHSVTSEPTLRSVVKQQSFDTPLPPITPRAPAADSPVEPVMRVTVQSASVPLPPPPPLPPDVPAALPPSAFASSQTPVTNVAAMPGGDDLLPPPAVPLADTAAGQAPMAIPAAISVAAYPNAPVAAAVPTYAQPGYAQPAYPPMAIPVSAAGGSVAAYVPTATPIGAAPMTAIPQAVPLPATGMGAATPPVVFQEAEILSNVGTSANVGTSVGASPAVSASIDPSRRRRASSPTALYLALPAGALIVLAFVLWTGFRGDDGANGNQAGPVAESGVDSRPPEPAPREPGPRNRSQLDERPSSDRGINRSTVANDSPSPPVAAPPGSASPDVAEKTPAPGMPATKRPIAPTPVDAAKSSDAVSQALTEARRAMSENNIPLAKAKLEAARAANVETNRLGELERLETLVQYLEGFWKAVREQIKGLKVGDQTMIRDRIVGVVEVDAEKLVLRVDGTNRTYAIDDLPIGVAFGLAESWLNKDEPASKIFLGAFQAMHPKGDRSKARDLWQQAADGGKGQEVALLMPELEVPHPVSAELPAVEEEGPLPPPKASDLTAAKTEVRQMFQADLAEATDAAGKLSLARKLRARSDEGDDPEALKFVMLAESARLAAEGGDYESMALAVDRQSDAFGIDAMETKGDLLFEAAKTAEGPEANEALAMAALTLSDEAVLLESDQAARLVRIALGAARKSGNSELLKQCSARDKEIRDLKKK